LEEADNGRFNLVKETEELRDKLEQYRKLCIQNEGYIDNLLK
jgi:hypothetical protein